MKQLADLFLPQFVNYLDKDLVNNSKKVINLIHKLGWFKLQKNRIDTIYEQIEDPNNPWYKGIENMKTELNENVRKKFIANFLIKANLLLNKKREKLREEGQVPFTILMDPTSACNLQCLGCWAKDYTKVDSMSYEVLDRIIKEGKEIGIYVYIYSGGEPLMRKKDIIKLCEKYPECYFMAFTNGTLIDDEFASEVARVGNFAPAISIEGFEEMTDFRRGKGVYKKVIKAMDVMKKHGNLFGFSACYHRKNTEVMGSDEFNNFMQEKGCMFGWFFTYMPVGSDAQPDLVATPEQRAHMYDRIRKIRNEQPMFLMDFWNDGEFVGGCIAGGRLYLHINAKGDVEPCAFVHYSSANINDTSLKDALKQPLFKEYRKNQPFNPNHLRPCPCLDNPEKLRTMVNNSKAGSTHLNDTETVEQFTAKCEKHASGWAVIAKDIADGNYTSGGNGAVHHKKEKELVKEESLIDNS